MNKLTGCLKGVNLIEGYLTPTEEMNLVGQFSVLNNVLTGTLVSTEPALLVGKLTLINSNNNILNGIITIPPEVPVPNYEGEYTIIPKPFNDEVLQTSGFRMNNNVTVLKIPYYQTSNETGYTIYIGGE